MLGTLARRAEEAGQDVVILTGDRDAFQLVSDRISVMATGRGVTDTTLYTPGCRAGALRHRPGADARLPRAWSATRATTCRASPGIGEKGASQLLQKYGILDAILDHAGEQTPKRREALESTPTTRARRATWRSSAPTRPVELDLDDVPPIEFGPERMEHLRSTFERFEFGSLLRRLEEVTGEAAPGRGGRPHRHRQRRWRRRPRTSACAWRASMPSPWPCRPEGWAVAADGDEVPHGHVGDDTGAALERAPGRAGGRLPRRQGRWCARPARACGRCTTR